MKKWQYNEQYGTGQYLLSRLQTWWRNRKVHRQVKDRLFRFLFEKDREALLQLYNALNGTDYKDASELEVVTIERAEQSLYGSKQITLPAPQCIVFYNGGKNMPEEQIIRLSDAFENRSRCGIKGTGA